MQIETVLGALADPTRLRIMRLLEHLELAVGEVAQALGQSQPRVSRHVAILCESGLAQRRREGSWVFLRRALAADSPCPLAAAIARLLAAAEAEDNAFAARCAEDRRHLAAIRATREKSAAAYFADHAEQWDSLRAMLSPAEEVEAALLDTLGSEPLGQLLDIGTGTGRIAEVLAPATRHIVGLDRSPEMLRLARARLQALPPDSWELVQANFNALPFEPARFDTIVLHQVLHFAAEPGFALAEAARVCRADGLVVVVDLAAHDHDLLRRDHAHLRLGFTDEQMHDFLVGNRFAPLPPLALRGKGLTTKIWIAQHIAQHPVQRGRKAVMGEMEGAA